MTRLTDAANPCSLQRFGRSIRRKCTSRWKDGWVPIGVRLPDEPLLPEVIARLIRMTGGNFRLLTRLLTQIERVLEVNQLRSVSTDVVEATPHNLRQTSPQTTSDRR
jgi:hypothetical protein